MCVELVALKKFRFYPLTRIISWHSAHAKRGT